MFYIGTIRRKACIGTAADAPLQAPGSSPQQPPNNLNKAQTLLGDVGNLAPETSQGRGAERP